MGADQAREWLIEFACDGIDPAREAQFRAYLDAEPELAAEWAEIIAVDAVLARVPAFEPDDDAMAVLRDNIGQALDQVKVRRPWFAARFNLAAAGAAACLLLGLLAIGVHPPRSPQAEHVAAVPPVEPAETEPESPAMPAAPAPAAVEPPLGAAPTEPVTSPQPITRVAEAKTAAPPAPLPAVTSAKPTRSRTRHASPTPRRAPKPTEKPVPRFTPARPDPQPALAADSAVVRMATVPPDRGPAEMMPSLGTSAGAAETGLPAAPSPRPAAPATSPSVIPERATGPAETEVVVARVVTAPDLAPVVSEALRVSRGSAPVLFALRPAAPPAAPGSADHEVRAPELVVDSAVIESVVLPGGGLTGRETR